MKKPTLPSRRLRKCRTEAVLGILLVSCSAQKRVWYLQDAQPFTPEQIAENGQIRIKPLDRLTIVVNSKDPELAPGDEGVPFNSATSYNSTLTEPTSPARQTRRRSRCAPSTRTACSKCP